ncbi:UNVERIFIED_CONTAM: hypothetical protein FKN15_075150 [Acipenser sinensis]
MFLYTACHYLESKERLLDCHFRSRRNYHRNKREIDINGNIIIKVEKYNVPYDVSGYKDNKKKDAIWLAPERAPPLDSHGGSRCGFIGPQHSCSGHASSTSPGFFPPGRLVPNGSLWWEYKGGLEYNIGRAYMGSYTLGMEDEQISVNVFEKEMPSIDSKDLDLENSRNSEEESVDVGIENADFVNNGQQIKVIQPDVLLDVHTHRLDICVDQDELSDQEIVRKPTAVDILKKGFGTSKPVTSNTIDNVNEDDQKESRDVSVDVILKKGTDQQGNYRESGIKNKLCIDQENVENVTLTSDNKVKFTYTESETDYVTYTTSTIQSKGNEETFQSKAHIYCTVHCMKNYNYRRSPLLDSLGEQNSVESQITLSSPVNNNTRVQTETDPDPYYNEPFNISSLIDSNSLGNLYSGDYKPFIVLTCRVCLEDKHIKPLHCCKKAVCEECLKRYLSSQVITI